jgi:hypothetical protein
MEARMKANMQIIKLCNMTDIFADMENICHLCEREYCVTVSEIASIKYNYNSSNGVTTW